MLNVVMLNVEALLVTPQAVQTDKLERFHLSN
jgi:hypothetical protein